MFNKESNGDVYKINDDEIFGMFVYSRVHFPLNVYFNEETKKNSKFDILYCAVQKSIERFNKRFNFAFFTIEANTLFYPNIVMVQIACGDHYGCISKFDGAGGVLAHATYPPFRKVCVDCKDIDFRPLYVVILHEFGHIIGLTHTTDNSKRSLMNPYIDPGLKDFTDYDVHRVRHLFKFLS